MRELFELAEFLTASWRLANAEARMPTSHGVLDKALFDLKDQLPPRYRDVLSFGRTRVGFRCYELPEILYCAQANLLTSEPNPTYLTTTIQIEDGTARRILRRLGVDPKQGLEFGKQLMSAAQQAQSTAAA